MQSDEFNLNPLFAPLEYSNSNQQKSFEISNPEYIQRLRNSLENFYLRIQALLNQSSEGEIALLDQIKEICFECGMTNAEDITDLDDYLEEMALFPQLAFVNNLSEIVDSIHLALNFDWNSQGASHDNPALISQTLLESEYTFIQRTGILQTILLKISSSLTEDIPFELQMSDSADTIEDYEVSFTRKYFEFSQAIVNILKSLLAKFEA